MKYIITECPAFREFQGYLDNNAVVKKKVDYCSKMRKPCAIVKCPLKEMLNKLKDIKRISNEYNVQYEIQQILDFYHILEIKE